ncbi:MAG: PAS domain S-box protein [Promethearchaeota archaeon]
MVNISNLDSQKSNLTKYPYIESILGKFGLVLFIFSIKKGTYTLEYISESIHIFGYEPKDFIKDKNLLTSLFYSKDYSSAKAKLDMAISKKQNLFQSEYRVYTKDHKIRWVHDETHLIYNSDGQLIRNETILRDITREKEQLFEFQDLSNMNQNILELMNEASAITNKDYKLIFINPAFSKLIGSNSINLLNKNFVSLIVPECRNLIDHFLKSPDRVQLKNLETKIFNSKQERKDINISILKLHSHLHEFIGVFLVINDISVLRKAEQDLMKTQIRYWSLFESANEAFLVIKEGKIEECNKKASAIFKCSKEDLIGRHLWELSTDYKPNISNENNKFNQIFENLAIGDEIQFQYAFRRFDKTTFEADTKFSHIRILEQSYIFCILNDNSFQRKLQLALTRERNLLNTTLNHIQDAVFSLNSEGEILLFNPMAENITGFSRNEVIGKKLSEVLTFYFFDRNSISFSLFDEIKEKYLQTQSKFFEDRVIMQTKSNLKRKLSYHCSVMIQIPNQIQGYVFVFRDITVQEKIREERLKAQKMESIGLLAGGIAHDFNNILASILGNVSIAKLELESENSEVCQLLNETEHAINRAKNLTKQLLTFSKGGAPIKKVISLKNLIEESTKFALRGTNIRYFYHCSPNLWNVEVDEGQIGQCLHNLIINAKQAMPEGGNIIIEASNVENPEKIPVLRSDKKYIMISILDQGQGIPLKIQSKIFDPYFTTKEHGSGLGLAIVYSIITNHGGNIDFDSKPGEGTIFYIYLPVAEEKSINQKKETQQNISQKTGRILIMDDERPIRMIFDKMLSRIGFKVDLTKEGHELLALYKNNYEKGIFYDYLILDLTIPGGIGGKEVAKKIKDIDKNQKIIVTSGYSNDPIMSNYQDYGFIARLEKPFTIYELNKIFENYN